MNIEKPTVLSLLQTIKSGIAFDLAKNHTGIAIWNGVEIERYGFDLPEYDKNDHFGYYKMRRNLRKELEKLLRGRHFEYCVVEDIYGGENIDTYRKLAEINTVPDECIFDNIFTVDNFFRWKPTVWQSKMRVLHKQKGKLVAKVEVQNLLEILEDDFCIKNKDLSVARKKDIFYEDICDATGMLLAVVAHKNFNLDTTIASPIPISKIKFIYLQNTEDSYLSRDKRVSSEDYRWVELDIRNLEKSISSYCGLYPDDVLCACVPPSKLGNFGLRQELEFYDDEEAYLFFYKK